MPPHKITFNTQDIASLMHHPHEVIEGNINGSQYTLRVAIPNYVNNILQHYSSTNSESLEHIYESTDIKIDHLHFGLICKFDTPIETSMHDDEMNLDHHLREIVDTYGPLIFKNVYLDSEHRNVGHRNRFPHLNFHRDRNASNPTPYSLFSRDPFDTEQVEPRTSSTLFVPNITAYLQCLQEKRYDLVEGNGLIQNSELYLEDDMKSLINDIVLENPWNEPHGTGEISILDNRTVLHASYYQNITMKSYRIGVRYLQ